MTESVSRRAARVVLLTPDFKVLLFRGGDPDRPSEIVWHIPGGGLDSGESWVDGAARELREETGFAVAAADLGEPIWLRSFTFRFSGVRYDQTEQYFLLQVDRPFEPDTAGMDQLELKLMTEHRWWGAAQLRTCSDLIAPPDLADRLEDLARDGRPRTPAPLAGATAIDGNRADGHG